MSYLQPLATTLWRIAGETKGQPNHGAVAAWADRMARANTLGQDLGVPANVAMHLANTARTVGELEHRLTAVSREAARLQSPAAAEDEVAEVLALWGNR